MAAAAAEDSLYRCHECALLLRLSPHQSVICPFCARGRPLLLQPPSPHRRFPSDTAVNSDGGGDASAASAPLGRRDRPPYNPVVALRNSSEIGGGANRAAPNRSIALFYYDSARSSLEPLPRSMWDFMMASGIHRVLGQLDVLGWSPNTNNPPLPSLSASKASIQSMPTIEITEAHIRMDCHCPVCKDPFELGTNAREMPCKHIYHQDCIFPWLSVKNSCPVCRHLMPTDVRRRTNTTRNYEDYAGITLIRLPHGVYAFARVSADQITGDLPGVYTEMDGLFTSNGLPSTPYRRIQWPAQPSTQMGFFRRAFRRLNSVFGCFRSPSSAAVAS